MDLNIKEEVDDKSFILQNYHHEIEESQVELKEPKIEFFQCEDCSEQFQIFELYELHKMVHGTVKICPHCKRTILKLSTFVKHIEDHIKNYFKCEYCPKIFFKKQIYSNHQRLHTRSEKRFQCTYCNKSFVTEKDLSIHVRFHSDGPPYKCDHCDKTFKHQSSLRTHFQSHKGKLFLCDVCDGTFRCAVTLKRHKIRMHDRGRKMTCKQCNLDFLNKKSFYAHFQQQHSQVYYRKCHPCNLEFVSKHKYCRHRKMHKESGNPLPFAKPMKVAQMEKPNHIKLRRRRCFLCGDLVDETHLKQHQDTHVETMYDTAYRCKECGEVSTTKRKALIHLDEHMKKTHTCKYPDCHAVPSMTYMGYHQHRFKLHKTVTCDDCKRQYTSKRGLLHHRRSGYCPVIASKSTKMDKRALSLRVHKNSLKLLKCNHCGRRIKGVHQMRIHIATKHAPGTDQQTTGQCNICNERFETKKDYDNHMKKRHGPQCQKCGRNFTSVRACQKHVKRDACSYREKDARQNEDDAVTVNQVIFCKYCACCLSGVTIMMEHLEEQHPDEDKYVCLLCEETFKTMALHLRHKKEHSENRARRAKSVVQLNEVICRVQVKEEPVDDNFVDVSEHVVVQQNGGILCVSEINK